jgi:hypothetical protein
MLPWYERDAAGVWTGREWSTEAEARAGVALGCSVHVELSAVVKPATFGRTTYSQRVSDVVPRLWKPRGQAGTD